jgi:hypothetical protein
LIPIVNLSVKSRASGKGDEHERGRHAILARLHFDPWRRQATRIALTCNKLIDGDGWICDLRWPQIIQYYLRRFGYELNAFSLPAPREAKIHKALEVLSDLLSHVFVLSISPHLELRGDVSTYGDSR